LVLATPRPQFVANFCGCIPFMAPEVLQKLPFDAMEADMWALGVTFFFMATVRLAWVSETADDMITQIMSGTWSIPDDVLVSPQPSER
jgi:serine/threonine protein kinase